MLRPGFCGKRSVWASGGGPGSRPGQALTGKPMLAEVTPRPGPAVITGPAPASPPPTPELSLRGAGRPDSSRPGPWARGHVSAGLAPQRTHRKWPCCDGRKCFVGAAGGGRNVAGEDDSSDSGFQQPREAAAGPLLPAFRECGPASSRPFGAPALPLPSLRPFRPADHLGLLAPGVTLTLFTLLAGPGRLSGRLSHPRAPSPLPGPLHLSAIWCHFPLGLRAR